MSDDDRTTEYRQYRFSPPPGACDMLLVRHGESEPARRGEPFPTVGGQADPALDPRGREEAERVAERLGGQRLAAIYVTPLRRTAETAAPLAARLGMDVCVEAGLSEVHLGEWEGAEFRARARAMDPVIVEMFSTQRWDVIPGAETNEALAARLRAGLERIAAAHPDERVAVFSHGGAIATIAALATGSRPFAFLGVDNGSLNHLVVNGDDWILRRFNDTGHLGTDLDHPPQPLT